MRRLLAAGSLVVAIVAAGIVGYALAGGFTTESAPGEDVSDRVMNVWATGDAASVRATYDPAVLVTLDADVVASSAKEVAEVAGNAIANGNTYKQIGPVAYYKSKENGDIYVASLVEVTGAGHPVGDPLVGFYRVRNGKVIRHIFIDAEHR